jgi:hypothetical protein
VIRKNGIPQKLLVMIQKMQTKNEAQVKTGNGISTGFRTTEGLKQGCGISPDLLKMFLESVLYTWNKRCKSMGLPTGNKTAYHLFCGQPSYYSTK